MNNQTHLPHQLNMQLKQAGIETNEIVAVSHIDRNLSCELADGYVILTDSQIICATSKPDTTQLFIYKEFPFRKKHKPDKRLRFYSLTCYMLDKIQDLCISASFSSCILYAVSEPDFSLALFSNTFQYDMKAFIEAFHRIKMHSSNPINTMPNEKDSRKNPPHDDMPLAKQNKKAKEKPKGVTLRIAHYFVPFLPKIALMVLLHLAISGLNLIWPYFNGTILYDKILNHDKAFLSKLPFASSDFVAALGLIVLTMVLTKLLQQAIEILHGILTAMIMPRVISDIKTSIFEAMGRLSLNFFTSRETGHLMTRVLSDADHVTNFFVNILPYIFTDIIVLVSTCIIMFVLNPFLACFSICILPILALISFWLMPQLFYLFGIRHRAERNLISQINDSISGARVVKAFGQEEMENERFDKYNQGVGTSEMLIVGFDNRFQALYTFVSSAIPLVVWGLGSFLILSNTHMEVGMLITFSSYIAQLDGPMNLMSHAFRDWTESQNCARRMFEIIDADPEITESKNPVSFQMKEGNITLKNVTFGYNPKRPVLFDLNLSIEGGSMLGIVGRSGAGKSTLVSLISRLYDPQVGQILIDGVDIRDISFSDLRKNIAMVSQETYIFMGTVSENIAYANSKASQEEIIQAAKLASAHDFICKLPNGYDTLIGSSGKALSGGERQRISIARAILANPRILILDEATASVDTETEKQIQCSLSYLVKGRTTLSIAHHLSTLRNAKQLVVIDNGHITEHGTHRELVENHGTYYKLLNLQTKALAMKGIE